MGGVSQITYYFILLFYHTKKLQEQMHFIQLNNALIQLWSVHKLTVRSFTYIMEEGWSYIL